MELNNLARPGALSVFQQFACWIAWLTAGRLATGERAAAISSARGCKCCVLVHGWRGAGVRRNAEAGSRPRRVAAGFVYVSPATAAAKALREGFFFGNGPNAAIEVVHAAKCREPFFPWKGLRRKPMKGGCWYHREAAGRQGVRINTFFVCLAKSVSGDILVVLSSRCSGTLLMLCRLGQAAVCLAICVW